MVKYAVKPSERTEEDEGQAKVMHLYIESERYKGHDQNFNGQEGESEISNDKLVFHEFKRFMEEYFMTQKYDQID